MFKFKKKKEKAIDKVKDVIEEVQEQISLKPKKSKKRYTTFEVVFISLITLMFGTVLGCMVSVCTKSVTGFKMNDNITEFLNVYNTIKEEYYKEVDDKSLIDAALYGMLNSLGDEYSYFMNENTTKNFNTTVDGTYKGVGITIKYEDGVISIIDIFKGSPADKVGLKVGDILSVVQGVDVSEKNSADVVDLIAGDVGKEVNITVKRGEETLDFSMKVAEIEIPSVYSEVKEVGDKKIGYISVDNFAANTYKQFNSNLKELEKSNIDSLIIDVRDNTGGHLSQVDQMLGLFFDKKTVLYQIETKGKAKKYYSSTNDKREYPIVVLVNSSSASASEVLTACFKENYKDATIVGTTTYGKGTVQKAADLSNGTSYKFTSQKWLTPKGNWIHEKGITPDIEVEDNIETEEDEQLDAAIKVLTEEKES